MPITRYSGEEVLHHCDTADIVVKSVIVTLVEAHPHV